MKYDLQEIATVSGMPGLFKVLKPTRTGVVLESLDKEKKRLMAQTRHKISILKEISIFTNTAENSLPLETVFANIYQNHTTDLNIDHKKASNDELKSFLGEVVPDFDEDRVYVSDIKKLVQWYKIVARELKPIEEEKPKAVKKKTEDKKEKKETKKAATKKKAAPKKDTEKKEKAPAKKKAAPKK